MSVFKNYSAYYDLLYQDKDYNGEVEYIEKLVKKHADNPKNVLELGCGTGKHAALLAEKGYNVLGVDLSSTMLEIAESRKALLNSDIANRLEFNLGNVQNVEFNRKFDVILSLFHVSSYQTTNEELQNYFLTAEKHLEPKGIFVFDSWYGPAVLTEKPEKRTKVFENTLLKIARTAQPVLYPNENTVDVNYDVVIEDKTTSKVEKIAETHKMRYLFLPEAKIMLENAGLSLIDSEEWITGKELGFNSWSSCFIAGKQA
ncbi:MAG TPA: class I SAM-dependent methyltransferase [Candidatus Gastranaerophilales bacterium]|nr:class I SAM-dependent methyltransferase [Candidatus Gastranaerophilales bacterium]